LIQNFWALFKNLEFEYISQYKNWTEQNLLQGKEIIEELKGFDKVLSISKKFDWTIEQSRHFVGPQELCFDIQSPIMETRKFRWFFRLFNKSNSIKLVFTGDQERNRTEWIFPRNPVSVFYLSKEEKNCCNVVPLNSHTFYYSYFLNPEIFKLRLSQDFFKKIWNENQFSNKNLWYIYKQWL